MMLSKIPAMLDCVEAQIKITFSDGVSHTETIESNDITLNIISEIYYMLQSYFSEEVAVRNHTQEDWIDRALQAGYQFPTDAVLDASEILEAIFDTYIANSSVDATEFAIGMIDHQGNRMPLEIEHK